VKSPAARPVDIVRTKLKKFLLTHSLERVRFHPVTGPGNGGNDPQELMKKREHKPTEFTASARDGAKVKQLTVLHVDDDPNDTMLLQAASRKAKVDFHLQNVEDGERAIAYLSGKEQFADRARYRMPSLVLLDLKMPRTTGFEILKWIRNHPTLNRLPVVVLSGSELKDDIKHAYAEGANSYLVKPLGFDALVTLIKGVSAVWLATGSQIVC
jgi:CheY-like chemotaxis protein